MPAGGSARHRNGGQRVFLVNTLFWKILVTRVKRKMREGKILIPLRELAAANSANQPPSPPEHEHVGSHWRGAARDSKSASTRVHSPTLKGVYARLRGLWTGVNALNDALCVAAATVRTGTSGGLAQYTIAATSAPWSTRSFGEYAFLEDSRYTRQAKNAVAPQFEFFRRAIALPSDPRGSSVNPKTALMRSR
jgi:hypothetical protein